MMKYSKLMIAAAVYLSSMTGAAADEWRTVDPENLVEIELNYGRVWVELAPQFANSHADRFRKLVRAKFYDGQSFYRVIDGFVAQGGIGEGDDKKTPEWPSLKAEFDRPDGTDVEFVPLGSPDLFADQVGHVDGFPVGRNKKDRRMWLLHCPGAIAMARDNDLDTGGTEFYIPIGHAPRRLDRNLTVFGRVLEGMQYLQKLNRGDPKVESGVIQDAKMRDPIIRMRMAADIAEADRPRLQVMDTASKQFDAFKDQRRNPAPEFYKRVARNLDICGFSTPVQRAPAVPPAATDAAPPPAPADKSSEVQPPINSTAASSQAAATIQPSALPATKKVKKRKKPK